MVDIMLNKRATEILKSHINNEDYQKVILTKGQYNFIYIKCTDIGFTCPANDEEELWNKVEDIFNSSLIDLGYKWNEDTFKWELPVLV